MNKCPRCRDVNSTVLLDTDGQPYLCDECWNDDGGDE
jgi:phage FluMu protein Com